MQKKPGTGNRESNDTYYTKQSVIDNIAKYISDSVYLNDCDLIVDFSAGDNRFLNTLCCKAKKIGFDINPMNKNVIKKDWFSVTKEDIQERYALCLNPPFGLQSNMIKKFLIHAFTLGHPEIILLIHPTIDLLYLIPSGYSVIHTEKLPQNSFERLDGKNYHTNASFSIFKLDPSEKRDIGKFEKRPKAATPELSWIRYTRLGKVSHRHSLLVRRTGVNFLRQAYIINKGRPLWYVENGRVDKCDQFKHVVDSEAFFKCEILDSNVDMLETTKNITCSERMDIDFLKTPPSTTNEHMNTTLHKCLVNKTN